jgi:hypothetical protein
MKISNVKLPAHGAGLPGEELSFILCPLTPPEAGLAGHVPAKIQMSKEYQSSKRKIFCISEIFWETDLDLI